MLPFQGHSQSSTDVQACIKVFKRELAWFIDEQFQVIYNVTNVLIKKFYTYVAKELANE